MIRVGIVGSGVGLRTHAPGFVKSGKAVVRSIYSPNFQKLSEAAERHNIPVVCRNAEDLISDEEIDLVVVASPNDSHEAYVRMCVSAGKAFLCEKPLGISADDARRIAGYVPDDYQQWRAVNHQLRFNPYLQRIRDILELRELGPLISLRIAQVGTGFSDPALPWSWSFDLAAGGGVRLAMGSHLVDLALFLTGDNISRIDATMHPVIRTRQRDGVGLPVDVSSTFATFGETESGATFALSATAAGFSGNAFDIEVFCERGEIRFDLESKLRVFRRGIGAGDVLMEVEGVSDDERANRVSIFSGSFPYFAKVIVRDIEAGQSSSTDACSLTQSVLVSEILDKALAAYRHQRSETLAPVAGDRSAF